MSGLIGPSQAGFIPSKQPTDNNKLLLHIIDKASQSKGQIMILSLDAEKAFDQVLWPYVEKVLTSFGLGERFRSWILRNYGQPRVTDRLNGITSALFIIGRGTRQGCPLLTRACDNSDITGVSFGWEELIISLYADNVIVALDNLLLALPVFLKEIEVFRVELDLYINVGKSQVLNLMVPPAT
ncbi:hypothetical protein NDU88_007260 [Pleurodeles waltl]|uniref:Reverse transcriptase domain-containing protein n=1 Tax=Pleurodeles waltl TaxID=8319 RepID=A0AAV7UNC0_PLEWA|nr:hypothetical protein NDU88_007260 [Pleurodeles waltl]